MTLANYRQFGGAHSETAALGNALACAGVTAPHTGQPFSEAMLLGVGGGIGAMYFVFDFKHSPPFLILYSRHIGEKYDDFPKAILERLGIPYTIHQSGGRKTADAQLRGLLKQGRPAVAWVDLASLPYRFLPAELVKYFPHVVTVSGWDEAAGLAYLDDLSPAPWPLPLAELAAGRGAITSQKNRLLALEPPERRNALEAAIRQGIRACAEGLTGGRLRNVSLTALGKWADLLTNARDKRGWPQAFPPGRALYRGLTATYYWIEASDTGGGAFRRLYATFLEEASGVLGDARLKDAAQRYRELAAQWTALAEAALPAGVPLLREAREAMAEQARLFSTGGPAALPQLEALARRRDELEAAAANFPMTEGEAADLRAELRRQVLALHAGEQAAAAELARLAAE